MEVAPGCCLFAIEPPSFEGEWGRFRDSGTLEAKLERLDVLHIWPFQFVLGLIMANYDQNGY